MSSVGYLDLLVNEQPTIAWPKVRALYPIYVISLTLFSDLEQIRFIPNYSWWRCNRRHILCIFQSITWPPPLITHHANNAKVDRNINYRKRHDLLETFIVFITFDKLNIRLYAPHLNRTSLLEVIACYSHASCLLWSPLGHHDDKANLQIAAFHFCCVTNYDICTLYVFTSCKKLFTDLTHWSYVNQISVNIWSWLSWCLHSIHLEIPV